MSARECHHNTSTSPIHNPTFTGECLVYEICDACHDIATTREHQHEEEEQ